MLGKGNEERDQQNLMWKSKTLVGNGGVWECREILHCRHDETLHLYIVCLV